MSVSDLLLEQVVRLHAGGQNQRRDETGQIDVTLWGKVAELGRKHGIPTPTNDFVYAALKLYANGPPT